MKKVIFYLLFSCILLNSTGTLKGQTISYKPLGPMDKPLPEMHIGLYCKETKEINVFTRCYVLSKEDFKALEGYINKVEVHKLSNAKRKEDYGGYYVTLISDGKKKVLIFYDKKASYPFFQQQLQLGLHNKDLVDDIQNLCIRLK